MSKLDDDDDEITRERKRRGFALQAALIEMRTVVFGGPGDRPNVTNVGVLVSDGHSTVDGYRTLPEAELAKADNITMLAVIVNADHNLHDMTLISSDPRTDLYLLTASSQLDMVIKQALDRLCNVTSTDLN